MGTARGKTQVSCLPLAARVVSSPLRVTVFCSLPIVAVGLKAMRIIIFSPLLIPPWIPPEQLLVVRINPLLSIKYSSPFYTIPD